MSPFRLAVLECDTPMPPIVEKEGTYGTIFEAFVRHGLESYVEEGGDKTIDLEVTTSNMVDMGELPAPDQVDCIMLTGSKHNAFEDQEWIIRLVDYVAKVYRETKMPIVGICFGHQIIARALGGKVERNAGVWEVSVDQIKLTPLGQKLFGVDYLALHQMHQDVVRSLPEGAMCLGDSPVCEIQGMYIPGRVLSVQGHPEFNGFIMDIIMRARQSIFTGELYDSGMARAKEPHDGLLVSRVIWKFLLNEL